MLSGHESVVDLPADRGHTLVLLMGVKRLGETADQLISAGHDADTPAAVVESGWSDQQRVTVGTLSMIAERSAASGARAPAVTVIGDVVTLSPHWV